MGASLLSMNQAPGEVSGLAEYLISSLIHHCTQASTDPAHLKKDLGEFLENKNRSGKYHLDAISIPRWDAFEVWSIQMASKPDPFLSSILALFNRYPFIVLGPSCLYL